jgi:rRNA processing protein Gar1
VVGSVVAFTPSGYVTVRSPSAVATEEGSPVRDRRGLLEGRVVRVFGPVARPYLLIRPRRSPSPVDAASLLGAEVLRG